jgi:DNA-binding beta-propeller fold protein YncE
MTTRRQVLAGLGAASLTGLAACGLRRGPASSTVPDTLIVSTDGGLAMLRAGQLHELGTAVLTPDAATVVAASPAGSAATDLVTWSTGTGRISDRTTVAGRWIPRTASPSGVWVALMAPESTTGPYPAGRSHTPIAVTGPGGTLTRLDLPGNLLVDAFATDGQAVYVLDWLPPLRPDRYRVRQVDLATASASALYSRDKQPIPPGEEEQMRGRGRMAAYAPGYDVLYTLYTNQPEDGSTSQSEGGSTSWSGAGTGFVHTLNLEQHWAYCVDLPAPFGQGDPASHTLAVAPDGRQIQVVDLAAGRVAVIDAATLAVTGTPSVPRLGGAGYAVARGETLIVAAGTDILTLRTDDWTTAATWQVATPVRGLALSPDTRRLYLAGTDQVIWLDPDTGARLGETGVTGITGLSAAVVTR